MRLVWALIPLVLVGLIGFEESFATVCFGPEDYFYWDGVMVFLGTSSSSKIISYDEPIETFSGSTVSQYSLHEFFLDETFRGNLDETSITVTDWNASSELDAGNQYFVFITETDDGNYSYVGCRGIYSINESLLEWIREASTPSLNLKKQFSKITYDGITENFVLTNLRIADAFDNVLTKFYPKQPVRIQADLTNISDSTQNYELVMVMDDNISILKPDWSKGELNSGEKFTYSFTWTPEKIQPFIVMIGLADNTVEHNLLTGLRYSFDNAEPSPRIQFKNGMSLEQIKCNEGLKLVFKSSNNSPACVTPNTAEKLIQRGWTR